MIVRQLDGPDIDRYLGPLTSLLVDAVDSGASVGFLAPLQESTARGYWQSVRGALATGHRILLGAFDSDALLGTVQLDLATMPNGKHRAEVMKLFVHRGVRRRGVGRLLMQAVESHARRADRTLLVLDTRVGDTAERLYAALGYVRAGVIPRYARSSSGELDDTVFMYRWLK